MATDKKGFILYADQNELFNQLSNEKAGELIKHIFKYVNDDNPISEDLVINLAFTPIKQQLKRDLNKWSNIREKRSLAGKASAEAKRLKKKQTSTNSTSVDSVQQTSTKSTVNDNVNVNVNVNDNVKEVYNTTAKADVIDFDSLIKFFNKVFNKKSRIIPTKVKTAYKERIKDGFTKEDISRAMINAKNSTYHKDLKYVHCTLEFFSRADKIDKFASQGEIIKPKYIPTIS